MSVLINNIQIIKQNGIPAFAVIPYEDYLALVPQRPGDDAVPQEVAEKVILENIPLAKAWRLHLGMTQREVAKKAGITQAALSQMERAGNPSRTAPLEKLAAAMELSVEQLRD